MSFPFDPRPLLFAAPLGVPLKITRIHLDPIRERCARLGLHEGDEVTCEGVALEHMSLAIAGRGSVSIALSLCTCVEVEPMEKEAWNRPPVRLPARAGWPAGRLARAIVTA